MFLRLVSANSAIVSTAAAQPAASGEIDFTALDAAVEAQMRKHGLPGVALAVVEGGEIVYLHGYGTAGRGQPMTAQTQMLIGSQSKSFTALAIAQLAEQGQIDLNAPVQTTIPWFQVADEEASARITVNHLLHHTSGLSDAGYGWTNLAYFRLGLPDVFILMLVGVIPDFVQGVVQSSWALKDRRKSQLTLR